MIKLQEELQQIFKDDPKLGELAEYMQDKIGPIIEKHKGGKPNSQWNDLSLKLNSEESPQADYMQTFSLNQFYERPQRVKTDNELELSASGQEASLQKRDTTRQRIEETETENQTDIEQTRDMIRTESKSSGE
jgi:hypothetical protein